MRETGGFIIKPCGHCRRHTTHWLRHCGQRICAECCDCSNHNLIGVRLGAASTGLRVMKGHHAQTIRRRRARRAEKQAA